MWRSALVAVAAGILVCLVLAYLPKPVGPAVLLAGAGVLRVLPYLVKQKCPACGAKSLRLVRPGLFQESHDSKCPCGYRETGPLIKTSWGVVAALSAFAVLFAAYMLARYGR